MGCTEFTTTYTYKPLRAEDHIRLLHIQTAKDREPTYQIIHRPLSAVTNDGFEFEAVSYTWGSPTKVSFLTIHGEDGTIALTRNLSEALPYLARHTATGYVWIDQICINQGDDMERARQVAMMAKIYRSAKTVIVWLGVETAVTRKCREWLAAVDEMLRELPNSHKMLPESPTFNPDIRLLIVRSTFVKGKNDPTYATAIQQFWQQPWFTRGWVVQECLLAKHAYMMAGDDKFDSYDLADMQTLPADLAIPTGPDADNFISYNILLNLKTYPLSEDQPKRFLKFMAQVSSEFITTELQDSLFAFLGMIDGSGFTPDYSKPPRVNFTNFAVALAKSFASIDFLSMWSANLDELLPQTPPQLKGFPSWVPSWTGLPLSCPFRMLSPTRTFRYTVCWDACKGKPYRYDQPEDAATTGRLHVRGQIVDRIERISSVKVDEAWGEIVTTEYLESFVTQLKSDIPGSSFSSWTILDFVHFLNVASSGGDQVRSSPEEVLGIKPLKWENELTNNFGYNESLGACLAMARGRRFVKTEQGRIGLVPVMGSKQKEDERRGSVIALLFGCSVPIVLEHTEVEGEYKVVGDCFIEDIMHGEGIEESAVPQTFILT